MKTISILGSTGSIGTQTLDVVDQHPETFEVAALTAGTNIERLRGQIEKYRPRYVSVASEKHAQALRSSVTDEVEIGYGEEGLIQAATLAETDFVVTAVVGSRGLAPTLAAIEARKDIGLANKETLVTAGHLIMEKVRHFDVRMIPIDSEHSAIFQCFRGEEHNPAERIVVTASGGSFRDRTRAELEQVTVEDALKHPNWQMGAKITIDSATMLNKGLEVIEAHWLFDMPYSAIDVVIHRESIIHSMVEFKDRSVMAQLGTPDMKVPIQYALSYPERLPALSEPLRLTEIGTLHFEPPDFERFPCLKMAYDCGQAAGTYPTVLNAANEVIAESFLEGQITFLEIEGMLSRVLDQHRNRSQPNIEEIIESDAWAREAARHWVQQKV